MRPDGRQPGDLRPVTIVPGFLKNADGSALIEWGDTRVLCTASLEERQPAFLNGTSRGWVTAEYALLPGATSPRAQREVSRGRVGGRTAEIQRLIGRSLRTAVDLDALGPRTVWLDCDVLQADGGTRTASVTGAWVALALALRKLTLADGAAGSAALRRQVAAVSAGVLGPAVLLDLVYAEDSAADVDVNIVMDDAGRFIEIQGTAERAAFDRGQLDEMLRLATAGIATLLAAQKSALER